MTYKNRGCKVAAAKRMQSCLEQLRAEGIDAGEELEFCQAEPEAAPLQITCGTATVSDLPPLDAAFCLPVRIIAKQSVTVDDCQITSPWGGPIRILDLPKPRRDGCYRLGTLSCRTEDFLNDKIGNQFTLRRGSIMEGVVLASGFPIPREMKGGVVNLRITLTDCFQRETWADFNALVRRNSERMVYGPEDLPPLPGKRDRARNGSGLYDSDPEGINERSGSIERSKEAEQRPRHPKVGKTQ